MKKFLKNHIPFLIMTFLLLLMIIFLIVFAVLSNNQSIAENWTRTIGRGYTEFFGKMNEKVPFSVTEVSLIIVIISCVIFLAWAFCLLRNGKIWSFIHRLLLISLVIVGIITAYNVSVGMAYKREALPLERYSGEIDNTKFKEIASYFVEDMNHCVEQLGVDDNGEIKMPYSEKEMINLIKNEFNRLDDNYYSSYTATPKQLMTSGLFTTVGIVGMYFGDLGEAHYNTYSTNAEKPFYICHELCHSKGVMREEDAQLLTTYLCLSSEDPLIRYSGYFATIDRILDIVRYSDDPNAYNDVKGLISQKVWDNFNYIYDHWKGKTFLSELGDKINDWYLKTFGEKEGTTSYIDTDTPVDDKDHVIGLSHYQSVYFQIYYNKNN